MKKENLKKTILTVVLVVVLLVTAYLVYTNFISKPNVPADISQMPGLVTPGVGPAGGEISPKLNTDVLKDPLFSELKVFGDVPLEVTPEEVGRPNPFIPFF